MSDPSRHADVVRVEFSQVEDCRRLVFLCLEGVVVPREQSKLAGVIAARLRDEGLLGESVEQHYSAVQLAKLLSRSPRHIADQASAGKFGPAYSDDGGWLIPASGVHSWLAKRVVSTTKEIAA